MWKSQHSCGFLANVSSTELSVSRHYITMYTRAHAVRVSLTFLVPSNQNHKLTHYPSRLICTVHPNVCSRLRNSALLAHLPLRTRDSHEQILVFDGDEGREDLHSVLEIAVQYDLARRINDRRTSRV